MMSSWAVLKAFLILVIGLVVAAIATTVLAGGLKRDQDRPEEGRYAEQIDHRFCLEGGEEYCCEEVRRRGWRRTYGDERDEFDPERCRRRWRREICHRCLVCCERLCDYECPPYRWRRELLGSEDGDGPRGPVSSSAATAVERDRERSSAARECRDGTFREWYEQDLERLEQGLARAQARSDGEDKDQRGGRFRRTIRVLTLPYFSRGPILYELRMDESGRAALTTIWLEESNRWFSRRDNAHRIMRHRGQHAAWRWARLRPETRRRTLRPDDAWRLWAMAGEINRASGRLEEGCMEEGNWLVVEEFPGRDSLHIAPLRGFNRDLDRLRYESNERGFDQDYVSERDVVRRNAETRFLCALIRAAKTPQRVLVRGDVADACHNMIRDPPLNEDDDGPDPYDRS